MALTKEQYRAFAAVVGPENISEDPVDLDAWAWRSGQAAMAQDFKPRFEAVVLPGGTEEVQAIVRKQGLGSRPEVQAHEDALCLVFLETQLADVAVRLGDDHAREVLVRTLAKMSPGAIEAALALDLPPHAARLLHDAATGDPPEQRER